MATECLKQIIIVASLNLLLSISRNRCEYEQQVQCHMEYEEECSQEKQQKCSTHYRKECKPSYNYGENCQNVPEQKCHYVTVPRCQKVPRQKCKTHKVTHCNKVPEQVCGKTSDYQCKPVTYLAPREVTKRECQIPHQGVPGRIAQTDFIVTEGLLKQSKALV